MTLMTDLPDLKNQFPADYYEFLMISEWSAYIRFSKFFKRRTLIGITNRTIEDEQRTGVVWSQGVRNTEYNEAVRLLEKEDVTGIVRIYSGPDLGQVTTLGAINLTEDLGLLAGKMDMEDLLRLEGFVDLGGRPHQEMIPPTIPNLDPASLRLFQVGIESVEGSQTEKAIATERGLLARRLVELRMLIGGANELSPEEKQKVFSYLAAIEALLEPDDPDGKAVVSVANRLKCMAVKLSKKSGEAWTINQILEWAERIIGVFG